MSKEYKPIYQPLECYPEVKPEDVKFPKEIYIAYAVCSKECDTRQFIVDGSTQICEYCGKSMFRTEVRKYVLAEDQEKVGEQK